jgi:hypothetical protein
MVNLWKVFWNDKQYFFPPIHAKFLVFSRATVTEMEWITTHDITHQHPLFSYGIFDLAADKTNTN